MPGMFQTLSLSNEYLIIIPPFVANTKTPHHLIFSGIITGIYTTNSVDSTQSVIESSGATIVVVDDAKQMDKVREIKRKMPHLKIVIQTREPFIEPSEGFFRWEDLENSNTDDVDDEYQRRLADLHANDCCSFIFTSGTTGHPKVISYYYSY